MNQQNNFLLDKTRNVLIAQWDHTGLATGQYRARAEVSSTWWSRGVEDFRGNLEIVTKKGHHFIGSLVFKDWKFGNVEGKIWNC